MSFDVAPTEAIDYFKNKKIIKRKEFDLLAEDARAGAFTVARVYKDDVLQGFKDEIVNSLETGTSQRQVIKNFRSILSGAGHKQLGARHLEIVVRSNLSLAYNTGRRRALESVTDDLPYWQYHAVMDDRVRPTHAALAGIIFPANHHFWDDHFPPTGFNCRCSVTALIDYPESYNHANPSGEAGIIYDDEGMPVKSEYGTSMYDLSATTFKGIPQQASLSEIIEARCKKKVRM